MDIPDQVLVLLMRKVKPAVWPMIPINKDQLFRSELRLRSLIEAEADAKLPGRSEHVLDAIQYYLVQNLKGKD